MTPSIQSILNDIPVDSLRRTRARKVDPSTPLETVYRLLARERDGTVVVCEGDEVVGIFTERDVLNRTALENPSGETPIGEIMTSSPATLPSDSSLGDIVRLMTEGSFRQIPLVDSRGRLAGLVSSRDVLGFISDHFPEAILNLPPRLRQHLTTEGG